jgi:TolB-like protein/Tfp pilus assembly protein PilF
VTEPSRAVFLSYASQDAEAAQRICEALRAAGIEVWFDQSELRGGDAWDQMIRRQIKACAIFIPVISRHTHERREGYFRLEWNLAVDRSRLISTTQAFLVPVVIDDTREDDEEVPEKIRDVHWTRLPGGETPAGFVERIKRLLSGEAASARPAGSGGVSGTPTARAHDRRRTGAVYAAIAAAVLLAVGYFGLERLRGSASHTQGAASIAVLPLTNESGEANQQYFSDGISEDLITALSQFPGLKVIGRTSAFQFRDSKEDSRGIGAKLGVAHLLEGSVRKSGDMIRVSAELIDTDDGSTQWSERYDRPYKDLFALQDEITHAVVAALRAKLLPGQHAVAESDRPPGGSLEAYNAWLQGNFYNHLYSEAGFRKAIEYYTQATQIDPRYARAWSSLAIAEANLGSTSEGAAAQEAIAKAREAADRALAIAPDSAQAHRARGALLLAADHDWHAAEAEFRRALALAPNDGDTKVTVGVILQIFGELGQALELTQQALATDPLRADWYRHLAWILFGLNRPDEAERAIRRVLELQPAALGDHALLVEIEIQRGDAQAALADAQQEPPGPPHDFALALVRQIGDDRGAADAALKALIEKYAKNGAYGIASIYAFRNDADQTFAWLDRAWSNHDSDIGGLLSDPFILRYRNDPRFAAFCRKVGLPVPKETPRKST